MKTLINLVIFIIIAQVVSLLHELGHAIVGLYYSDENVKVSLGNGTVLKKFSVGRLEFEIKNIVLYGGGHCITNTSKFKTNHKILFFLGGPIVSLFIYILCKISYEVVFSNYVACGIMKGISIYALIQFIVTILPMKYPKFLPGHAGNYSDGYKILNLLKVKKDNKICSN